MSQTHPDRIVRHRMAVLRHAREVSENVAATCRYYGISRPTFYAWAKQYDLEGPDGLRERARAPKSHPQATSSEMVGKIIHLRQTDHFGPAKITMYLKRYHDIEISNSGVWRILKRLDLNRLDLNRLDLNRLPSSQRYKRHERPWKRYERQQPGQRIQIDVKFIAPLKGSPRRRSYHQFTAIDDCTRLRVLRIYPSLNQKTAIQFVDYVVAKLPFAIDTIQIDNGSEFQSSFHWHVLDKGINHVHIKPRTPRLNGRVERSHRIDAEEFYRLLDGVTIDDAGVFNIKLQEWEDYYN